MSFPLPNTADNNALHTDNLIGLAELMTRVFRGEDISEIGDFLMQRAQRDDAHALLDLSVLLQLQGHKETGVALQNEALSLQQSFTLYPAQTQSQVKLLAIYTRGDLMTNTPLEFLAEGSGFTLQTLYIADDLPEPAIIPPHDVAMVAISELDRNLSSLPLAQKLMPRLKAPVLNRPDKVAKLSRDTISQQMQGVSGIEMPLTLRLARQALLSVNDSPAMQQRLESQFSFPVIIRPIDSHAGKDLAKVDNADELQSYLQQCHCDAYFIAPYIDYRSDDGHFKKYRIMVIDGAPYLAHMAISDDWMIHYLNAGMLESAEKRFEEAQAMGNFDRHFGARHREAFKVLTQEIGLEYYGVDCAETTDGKLLVFEACASLNVHAMDCPKTFPYKQPQMKKIFDAFHQMLLRKAAQECDF
ncbi:MAG: ATP-grasp domain-containing protein [Pseudomonadales bacterium]